MPMDFPNMKSLTDRAKRRGFRKPIEGETEDCYRSLFAYFMDSVDMVEANEIRNKVGWDKWTDGQKLVSMCDAMFANDNKGPNSFF